MKNKLQNGLYLVVDPSLDRQVLLDKLQQALMGNIAAVQIWDNFKPDTDVKTLSHGITELCKSQQIPVLINNRWELLLTTALDGVHFDQVPENFEQIKQSLSDDAMFGITCGNDLSVVEWAHEHQLAYISFCSIFPSTTANSCELVSVETIKAARKITSLPIFLAGGIKPENISQLSEFGHAGIAVVSGIMNAEKPIEALKKYEEAMLVLQDMPRFTLTRD